MGIDNGHSDQAKSDVWPLVNFDMEWAVANWDQMGCDLWEEVRSNNFYFNRAGYIYSLNVAADFADKIGEARGEEFRTKANEILGFTKDHYGKFGDFIYEAENRPYDGAVIHSIATFGEYIINQDALSAGKPGILIGRYPNDGYAGGNP